MMEAGHQLSAISCQRERRAKNVKSKFLFWLLTTLLLVTASSVHAQRSGKPFRIGILDSSTASGSAMLWDQCRQELKKLGWTEGKDIAFEFRFAEGKNDRLFELASELAGLKVDAIMVSETTPALAAKKATSTIPVVFTNVGDPVTAGLVASLARPGGNLTGLSSLSTQLNTKRLEVLKDAIPKLARVAVLRPAERGAGSALQLEELRPAAEALKIKLEEIETRADAKGLESAFQSAKQLQVGAIMTTAHRTFFAERNRIVDLAGKFQLPAIYFQREFVDFGGLMSYGVDYTDLFRKAAHYVDKILKGTRPADLPVQQATKFEFIINLKAAKQIGLTMPLRLLERANRVIK